MHLRVSALLIILDFVSIYVSHYVFELLQPNDLGPLSIAIGDVPNYFIGCCSNHLCYIITTFVLVDETGFLFSCLIRLSEVKTFIQGTFPS